MTYFTVRCTRRGVSDQSRPTPTRQAPPPLKLDARLPTCGTTRHVATFVFRARPPSRSLFKSLKNSGFQAVKMLRAYATAIVMCTIIMTVAPVRVSRPWHRFCHITIRKPTITPNLLVRITTRGCHGLCCVQYGSHFFIREHRKCRPRSTSTRSGFGSA